MHPILSSIITLICFLVSIPIGGYLARKLANWTGWTMDDEIKWWIDLAMGRRH